MTGSSKSDRFVRNLARTAERLYIAGLMSTPTVSDLRGRVLDLVPRQLIEVLSRVKTFVRRQRAARRFAPVVAQVFPSATSHELLVAFDDSAVIRVEDDGGTAILKVASSAIARAQLTIEANALDELAQLSELGDWRTYIASVKNRGDHASGSWFTQSMKPGTPLSTIDEDTAQLVSAAATALHPVHDATAQTVAATDAVLDEIVTRPLAIIRRWRPELAASLDTIGIELQEQLGDRNLTVSRLHGDFAPSNVLWDPETESVSAIVDWKFDEQYLPPEVDLVHFALSLIAQRRRVEYGDCVIWLLDQGVGSRETSSVELAAAAGPNGFDMRLGLMVSWLQHVSFGLQKAADLRTNSIWLRNNIDRVVQALVTTDH